VRCVVELALEVLEGPDAGRRVPLRAAVEVGRDPGLALALSDKLVSRHHARISPGGDGVTVEDLGSRHGTFLNGARIDAPTEAAAGDHILVGLTVLRLGSG
jgi:pSer/pThr/pTyr-binding forkhead associated (FHA) protein